MNLKLSIATVAGTSLMLSSLVVTEAHAVTAVDKGEYCGVTFTSAEQKAFDFPPATSVRKTELEKKRKEATTAIAYLEKSRDSDIGNGEDPQLEKDIKELTWYRDIFASALSQCAGGQASGGSGKSDPGKGENVLSTEVGSLNEAGIGVVSAGVILLVLAATAAALPTLKPLLPANIVAILP